MGDRYILEVECPTCKNIEKEVYYAPTCGFLIWTCPQCNTTVDLGQLVDTLKEESIEVDINKIRQMFNLKKAGLCPFCQQLVDVNSFVDELSRREFKLSGLCQKCQDSFFGNDLED